MGKLILFWILRALFSMRYRLVVHGLENIRERRSILFLPNHPAEIDPVALMLILWPTFKPRPVIVENFYVLKGIGWLMRLIRCVPLPDLNGSMSRWKVKKVDKATAEVTAALAAGDNFLIYPAGKLKLSVEEKLAGASFVHTVVQQNPAAAVVLVRTCGLWGSLFSRAITGEVPDFLPILGKGLKIILKNGIFFTPRRPVEVWFESVSTQIPRQADRLTFNRYLEAWYNQVPDQLRLISFAFWKQELPTITVTSIPIAEELSPVPPQVEKEVYAKLAQISRKPLASLSPQQSLTLDLGLDSLDISAIHLFLDAHYEVGDLPSQSLHTVGDVLQAATKQLGGREKRVEMRLIWPHEQKRASIRPPAGATLAEAFLYACSHGKGFVACADKLTGALSYRRLKLGALLLSRYLRALQGTHVGILLPSTVSAYLAILACLLAKKIPVMLNWTVGPRAINHALEITGINTVLSASRFLESLGNEDLGAIDDKLVLLDELRSRLSWKDKGEAFLLSLYSPATLMNKLELTSIHPDDPAVILFTSGTEALPKAVPLSHNNILSNQRAAFACASVASSDILYGVLPPFHSFGFTVTGLLPLLSCMKVYYGSDPTDSHQMANDIAQTGATLFFCAPSFIKALFQAARPQQLRSIRLFVSGAEKTPPELFKIAPSELIEGYGITECAPIVTLNRPGEPPCGVGKPLPGVELCIIDLETTQPLPQGSEGEICVHGPNVFSGYLKHPTSPFLEIEGKRWYRTGDRGHVDLQGNLILSGRLKRFIKVGAEMVSLGGLEEEVAQLAILKQWVRAPSAGPLFAVAARTVEGEKPQVILFTTLANLTKEEVNTALLERGYGRIIRIAEVRKLDVIPLTGTGKVNYRLLDEL